MMDTRSRAEALEDELDEIRRNIYEKIKGMTAEEEIAYFIAQADPVYKEFNIRRSPLEPVIPRKRAKVVSE